jgi:hypothetical protein
MLTGVVVHGKIDATGRLGAWRTLVSTAGSLEQLQHRNTLTLWERLGEFFCAQC